MKNFYLFFIAWFFGFLLMQVGEFFYISFDFEVIEASRQLVSEVSFAQWQLNTPPIQGTKIYLLPEVPKSGKGISNSYIEPVKFSASTLVRNSYSYKSKGYDFLPGSLSNIPVYLFNRFLRL